MKKQATEPTSSSPKRRRQRMVQYLVLLVGCVVVIDALVGDKGLIAMIKSRQQYRALEGALGRVTAENAQLREQARRLREDPTAIEEIARRELGLIRPGEKLFIVKDITPDDSRNR